jgi:hypothetical protein
MTSKSFLVRLLRIIEFFETRMWSRFVGLGWNFDVVISRAIL